jgi:predicted MFS family arabinose efflux permease
MITWGIVAASFSVVTDVNMFYVLRFVLGIAEAGFFPGIIYFLTLWFSARRRSTITGMFFMGMPLSMVFGGPLSGLLMDMEGLLGFHGWQWMFVIEGLMASVVGLYALWYLVDKPQDANWITANEKEALLSELKAENSEKSLWYSNPWRVLIDPRVLFLCIIYLAMITVSQGINFYLPTQVAGLLGMKVGLMVGLVSAIPYACAAIALFIIPAYSDHSGKRSSLAALLLGCCGIALIVSSASDPMYGIFALCIALTGYVTSNPIFWTMPPRFLTGVTAASGIGLINSIGNLWGFVAPNLRVWAEHYFHNPSAGLYAIGSVALLGSVLLLITIVLGMGSNMVSILNTAPLSATQTQESRRKYN